MATAQTEDSETVAQCGSVVPERLGWETEMHFDSVGDSEEHSKFFEACSLIVAVVDRAVAVVGNPTADNRRIHPNYTVADPPASHYR